jgi:hypothetical protein
MSLLFSRVFVEIPYSTEQGIILEEQGISWADQRNSFWWGTARDLCVFWRGWSLEEA